MILKFMQLLTKKKRNMVVDEHYELCSHRAFYVHWSSDAQCTLRQKHQWQGSNHDTWHQWQGNMCKQAKQPFGPQKRGQRWNIIWGSTLSIEILKKLLKGHKINTRVVRDRFIYNKSWVETTDTTMNCWLSMKFEKSKLNTLQQKCLSALCIMHFHL